MLKSVQPLNIAASPALSEELRYRLLKLLAERPNASQREIAQALGVSLGKVNYCLRALARKGWIKAGNFRRSPRKAGYRYILTPRGVEAKVRLTYDFLRMRLREYEAIEAEIARLRSEIEEMNDEAAETHLAESASHSGSSA